MPKYFDYIGLCKNKYPAKRETYSPLQDANLAKKYLEYLNGINANQYARQQTIENKNSQLLGQSSIVISIVALFIPLFVANFDDIYIGINIVAVIFFVFIVFHYVMTILHSTKTLEIDKSKYMTGATSTVTKANRKLNELDFVNEEIADLVAIINHNNSVTNKIAANLVYASRCFKIANLGFLFFSFLLIISSVAVKRSPQKVEIANIKELKNDARDLNLSKKIHELDSENKNIQHAIQAFNERLDSL